MRGPTSFRSRLVSFALGFLILFAGTAFLQAAPAPTAPQSETRFALVIGNGSYANVPLKNPGNDARDVAKALGNLGFTVTLVVDGDMAAMVRAVRDFGNAIRRPDAVALFYYSGHGVQYRGANYLIPSKADIVDPDELSFGALNVEQVYAKMESAGDKTNIIVLDACRNNPFPGAERSFERGLAVVSNVQPPQSLIVYATAPGKTAQDGDGRNGTFTAALLKHLADPSLDAEIMMRRVREDVIAATGGNQVPWHNSSITGSGFAFAGGGTLAVSTDPAGADIYVNGQKRGVSPLSLSDLPRYSEIEISARSGNRSIARRIVLKDAVGQKLDLKLEVARGSILVTPNEKVLKALVDGVIVAMGTSGQIDGVEVGLHTLELQGDSSAYKGQVEVVDGKTAPLKAALVPQAFLTLTLPANTVCRLEGPGIDETTTRWNYGQIPAGRYRLTVSGGDYEPLVESISVERAQRFDFAPKLRYTAGFLQAKFGADLDRLLKLADSGLASQNDISEAALLSKRIRAEQRPELAALASRADALSARLAAASVPIVPATVTPAAPVVTATTGMLSLTSDPPGIKVSIDDGDPVQTPWTAELAPGSHSIQPLETYVESSYYVEQPKQWVSMTAGATMSVPVKPQAAKADLAIRLVPDGYDLVINGEKVGVTPLGQLSVKAGVLNIRFERSGETPRIMRLIARPNGTAVATWGTSPELAVQLPRRNISLDGKTDSWSGVDPLVDASGYAPTFMLEKKYAITQVYMCRNDKDLFWRVDFAETNPLLKPPKGVKKAVICQLSIRFDRKQLNMGSNYDAKDNRIYIWRGIWNDATQQWSELPDKQDVRNSDSMLVGKIGLDKITKYCNGPYMLVVNLANESANGWEPGAITTEPRYVDFSK
jgi:hypothetical protein